MRLLALLFSVLFLGQAMAQSDDAANDKALAIDRQRIFIRFWDNPALTGGEGQRSLDAHASSRFETKYSYFFAYSNRSRKNDKLAFGYAYGHFASGSFGTDILPWRGTLTETTGQFTSSYRFEFGEHLLRPGMSIGYMQKQVNWEQLTFGDMIDPRYGFIYETQETQVNDTRGNLDLQLGIEYLFRGYYFEAAMRHVTQPPEGFVATGASNLPAEWIVHSGYRLSIGKSTLISPYLIYRHRHYYDNFTPGILGEIGGKVLIGFSYENLNTFIFNSGYIINKKLRVLASVGMSTELSLIEISPIGYWKGAITYFINDNIGG